MLLILIGGFIAYQKYQQIFKPNVPDALENDVVYLPSDANFEFVVQTLVDQNIILDESSFRWVAGQMNYGDGKIKPGRYQIPPGLHNRALVGLLRSGNQSPVKVTIRAAKNMQYLAGIVEEKLEFDSLEFLNYVYDQWLPASDFNVDQMMTVFIPNTYEFFWNTSPEKFMKRMEQEHQKFWTEKRKEKAEKLGLTPAEVYTLASIVERETQNKSERSRIAGVYLNRIRKGMLLQADPTVIFAHQDFSIRRVLNRHLEIDSPYNTYKYAGLPPGPIYMPTINSIDASLNAEDHDYIFFCVNPETPGAHAFASTLRGHNRNARRYQNWANRNGIR